MESIGEKITKALTSEQIAKLFEAIFNSIDSQKTDTILNSLDSDIKETLSKILSPDSKNEIVSSEKNIEKWNELWSEWDDVVSEVGDEEGEYVYNDCDWEPPSFNGSSLAGDLEKIAEKMFPLIDEIYTAGIEEDNRFIQSIEEIEDNMDSYPEWMAEPDEFYLKSKTTKCLLKWEFLFAKSPIVFLNKAFELEGEFHVTELSRNAFIDFFTLIPKKERKEIYDHITAKSNDSKWKSKLDSVNSKWHKIYHFLTKDFDHNIYLNTCRKMLNENWHYGMPLVEDFLKKGEKEKAENAIKETFSSLLTKKWNPEKELLIKNIGYRGLEKKEEIVWLIEKWLNISGSIFLRIQLVTFEKNDNWDAVAEVYSEVKDSIPEIADKLTRDWCKYTVNYTLRHKDQDCWINWLLETGLQQKWNKEWFIKKVEEWLLNTKRFPREPDSPLFVLTRDLLEIYGFRNKYPKLHKRISEYGYRERSKSRQKWLRKIESNELIPSVIECWQKNVKKIMPDPSSAHKSNYNEHAEWLSAAKELGSDIYVEILAQWRVVHKRRTNLWKAIKDKKLPV